MAEFAGLAAAVTGGASGIGLATAQMLAARGARVAVLDLASPPAPDELPSFACDVADVASVGPAVEAVFGCLGGIDVLINNAGVGAQGTVADNDDSEWLRVLQVNVLGMVRVTRAALPALRRSARPAVVNMCSVAAAVGLPNRALYSASKGAVAALTRAMAADYLPEGIRVNCVSPGTVDTPWVSRLLAQAIDPGAERAALVARQPHRRLVSPEEVAAAVCYLAGPASGSTTGVDLLVDGGLTSLRLPPRVH